MTERSMMQSGRDPIQTDIGVTRCPVGLALQDEDGGGFALV